MDLVDLSMERKWRRKRQQLSILKSPMECADQPFKRKRKRTRPQLSILKGKDWISNLPNEILVSILSCLTLKEAALTSVLSKRWRCIWTNVSTLNFDANVNGIYQHFPLMLRNCSKSKYKYWNRLQDKLCSQYINWVSCVLAQHKGLYIDEFKIRCDNLNETSSSHIDKWIDFALSKKVHTIELDLFNGIKGCKEQRYAFPYGLLGCLNNSHMTPSVFVGFKFLKILSLKAVDVCDEAIDYFLCNCHLLEQLFLHDNGVLRNLRVVCPSPMLRHLEVVRCILVETIEIHDTNMVSFTYGGKQTKILLKNAPLLTEVSIDCDSSIYAAKTMLLTELSQCLPQLEILQLKITHGMQEISSAYIFPELKNLKQFVLIVDRWTKDCLLGFLAMIKNMAKLQRFVLQLRLYSSLKHDEEIINELMRDVMEVVEYHHHHLKVVEIVGYCSYESDFELVKQVIENAVALEKIIIDTRNPALEDDESEDKEEWEKSDRKRVAARKRAGQLRTQVPDEVELIIL